MSQSAGPIRRKPLQSPLPSPRFPTMNVCARVSLSPPDGLFFCYLILLLVVSLCEVNVPGNFLF